VRGHGDSVLSGTQDVVQDGIEFGHGEIVDHPVITAGKTR